jgi:hypothetical protein
VEAVVALAVVIEAVVDAAASEAEVPVEVASRTAAVEEPASE